MKKLQIVFLFLIFHLLTYTQIVSSQTNKDFVKFNAKIGFLNGEDKIKSYQFSKDGRRIFILGFKNIQLWDVKTGKLLSSVPYSAQVYPTFGKLAAVLTFGLSTLAKMEKLKNDPEGDYFVAVEGEKDDKTAVVRDIEDGRQLARLLLPLPTDSISFEKSLIVTRGENKDKTQLGIWDNVDFRQKAILPISEYKWHRFLKNDEKILIGSGYTTKTNWFGDEKQGGKFEIRDVKSGRIEKEFTAPNLAQKDYYYSTVFTPDEKFMMSRRDNRIFVWQIDGSDLPKYIIETKTPKGDLDFIKVINQQYIVAKVDKKLRIYDFGGDGQPKHEIASNDPKKSPQFLGNSQDGKYFAVKRDEKVSFYEINGSGQPFSEVSLLDKDDRSLTCLPEDYCILENKRRKGEQPKLYLYNIKTGKADFDISYKFSSSVKITPDKNFLYEEETGKFSVWNLPENRYFSVPLVTYALQCEYSSLPCVTCDSIKRSDCHKITINDEQVLPSPNEKFVVRFGKYTITLFDAKDGTESQSLFDPQKVTYGKNSKVSYSGFETAEFSTDGEHLLTRNDTFYQTISVWDLID